MPGAAAPAGGLPPWTTLNRIPRGHSGPPRDVGFWLRESPQKIRVQGGRPPTDTTAPDRLRPRSREIRPTPSTLNVFGSVTRSHRHHDPQPIQFDHEGSWTSPARSREMAQIVDGIGAGDERPREADEGGRGVTFPGPYLLGSLSTPPADISWRATSGHADCDSAWSGKDTPRPPRPPRRAKTTCSASLPTGACGGSGGTDSPRRGAGAARRRRAASRRPAR